ncbi:13700_t:CDS:2, partial [Racocetra persica]
AKELFEFLNSHLKLSECWILSGKFLDAAIAEENEAMYNTLCKDKIGKPYVWKATDISLERESHIKVIEKTNAIINKLKSMNIKVSAVVTDSARPYAAS